MTTHRPPADDLPRPYPYPRPASTPPPLDAAWEARKATFRRDLGTLRAFFDECETVPAVRRCA